jgi:hypothetical protein
MSSALACPVCRSGPELRTLDADLLRTPLRRCDDCLGVLADSSSVVATTAHYHSSHYLLAVGHGRHQCRNCRELFAAPRESCRQCGKGQTINCARCRLPMQLLEVQGVTLDVCRPCRMVWFDRGELGLLLRRHSIELQSSLEDRPSSSLGAGLAEAALSSPDLIPLAAQVSQASGKLAVEALSGESSARVVEVLATSGEAAAELTTGAIEVVCSILGDIF